MSRTEKILSQDKALAIIESLGYDIRIDKARYSSESDYISVSGAGFYNLPIRIYCPIHGAGGVVNRIFDCQKNNGHMEGRAEMQNDFKKLLNI